MMRRYPEAIEFFDKSLLLDQNPEIYGAESVQFFYGKEVLKKI